MKPASLRPGERRPDIAREVREMLRVPAAELVRELRAAVQPLARILADGLQHGEPPLAADAVDAPQQALVHERLHPVDDVHFRKRANGRRHPFDVLEPRAGEDSESLEQQTLVGAKQLVAPLDRPAERPLPVREIARPSAEQIKPAF